MQMRPPAPMPIATLFAAAQSAEVLRFGDVSHMPKPVAGKSSAPTMVIAETIARRMLARTAGRPDPDNQLSYSFYKPAI